MDEGEKKFDIHFSIAIFHEIYFLPFLFLHTVRFTNQHLTNSFHITYFLMNDKVWDFVICACRKYLLKKREGFS